MANNIRWGRIADASDHELAQYCRSCYSTQNVTDNEINEDIKELKNLLVETPLRHILSEEASGRLREKAEEIFSTRTEFPISLSNLK